MIVEIERLLREQSKAIFGLDARQRRVIAEPYGLKIDKLQAAAQKAFAVANGWSVAGDARSAVKLIPREKQEREGFWEWGHYAGGVSDHDFVCKVSSRVAAVVCQPYNDHTEEAKWVADRLGLAVDMPPDPRASIWYPGYTRFYVFTRPGVEVRWLKDQIEWQQVEEPADAD